MIRILSGVAGNTGKFFSGITKTEIGGDFISKGAISVNSQDELT